MKKYIYVPRVMFKNPLEKDSKIERFMYIHVPAFMFKIQRKDRKECTMFGRVPGVRQ